MARAATPAGAKPWGPELDPSRQFALYLARQLGMTGRTLQRRLAAGLVFSDLVDMVRLESARLRLAEGNLSLAEVAYMVGFAEQSSFSRAFKRWTA